MLPLTIARRDYQRPRKLGNNGPDVVSGDYKGLTWTDLVVCTSGEQTANASPPDADRDLEAKGTDKSDVLAILAAALANLPMADRARLVAMLTAKQGQGNPNQ